MPAFDPLKIKKRMLGSGFSLIQYGEAFCVCGQPQKQDLEELKKEGWDLILNLRNPEEMESLDFKMEELCRSLGLSYQLLPVLKQGDLSKEAFQKIHEISTSGGYKKIMIHCASGRRAVLALTACFFFSNQCRLEDLPETARQFDFESPKMISRLQELVAQ